MENNVIRLALELFAELSAMSSAAEPPEVAEVAEAVHLHEEEPAIVDVRLSKRQKNFCALVAGGETKAAAYQQAYTMTNHLASAADCAARALLRQQKIRDRIDECRADLGTTAAPVADRFDEVRAGGARGGWCFQLTPNQEKFCQATARGLRGADAFKAAGYATKNYTWPAMANAAMAMLQLPKIHQRIAALEAGDAPEITTVDVGRRPRKKVEEVVVEVSEPAEEEDTMPPRIAEALERYAESRLEPGSFLRAALENDLGQAILAADPASLEALPVILDHIANRLQPSSHGSPEKVAAWLASERDDPRPGTEAWRDHVLRKAPVSTLQAYLDAERDVGEARGGGTD